MFTLSSQLIIFIIKSTDCLHYWFSWLFTLLSQLIIYIIKSADYLHYQVGWLFTLLSQLIVYMIKSADCLHYHRLIWRVFQVATTGSSGPSSLMGVRFAYSAMEQALPHIVEEVRIKENLKTNKSSYLMLSRFLYELVSVLLYDITIHYFGMISLYLWWKYCLLF